MVTVADIQNDLAGWPDDVVGEWLHYFANEPDCGWPPPDPLGDHRWSRLLGGRPLSWWKNVTWNKETVSCDLAGLSDKSRGIAETMITEIGNRTADDVTRRRYQNAMQYILEHGVFPGSIVAMRVSSGMQVLDGNHRMGAFCGLQRLPDAFFERPNRMRAPLNQEVWIGNHSAGEVALT
jgi:hypothetical protein